MTAPVSPEPPMGSPANSDRVPGTPGPLAHKKGSEGPRNASDTHNQEETIMENNKQINEQDPEQEQERDEANPNHEAAKYRRQLREVEAERDQLKAKFDQFVATVEAEKDQQLRAEALAKFQLPQGFADKLQGSTRAELEASAKEFRQLMGPIPGSNRDVQGKHRGTGRASEGVMETLIMGGRYLPN